MKPGTSVTPTIRLVRCLGVGGMGSVWVADHQALRTQVVVKFMSTELAASAEAVERFSREAAAAAQVKSPHVVQMLDHGVTPDGVPFIAMELLEGRDLANHLAARGRLSLVETADIVTQVAKALGRAHERGIVHRDIKPENIFLCDVGGTEQFVKILDFGIAKGGDANSLSNGTKTGAMIGTPYYMSPEQMMGSRQLDPRTDLWSLGIVVYQCVLGHRPFEAETFGALAVMIHSGQLPQPTVVDPTIPRAFDGWFERACSRNPEARFATAKELADTLQSVARGESWEPRANTGPAATSLIRTGTDPNRPSTNAGLGLASGRPPAASKGPVVGLSVAAAAVVMAIAGGGLWLAKRTPPAAMAAASNAPQTVPVPSAPPSAAVTAPLPDPPAPTETTPPAAASSATNPALRGTPASGKGTSPQPAPGPSPKKTVPPPAPTRNEKDIF